VEINSAYRRLSDATEDLLYLDGLLDTDDHRRLEDVRERAELDHRRARREVDLLHLIVRLLKTGAIGE
jgi:hypothetical protein